MKEDFKRMFDKHQKVKKIIDEMDKELEYLMKKYDESVNDETEDYYCGKYNAIKKYYDELKGVYYESER